jgi:hypothetical protein
VQPEPGSSWLKDPRVRGAIAGAALAGFLIGLLVFGQPWHRSPDFGDIPTWLAAAFAAFAGWIALHQLGMLREQMAEEADRNAKRDQVLDSQLAEARTRSASERRRQAEGVKTDPAPRFAGSSDFAVVNDSGRPIADITCRVISKADGHTIAQARESGIEEQLAGRWLVRHPQQVGRVSVLPPGKRCGFNFVEQPRTEDPIRVAWFTDDAGHRWQIDEQQHLAETNGDEYKP